MSDFSKPPISRLLIAALLLLSAFVFVAPVTYAAEAVPIKKAKKAKKAATTTDDDRGLAVVEKNRDSSKRVALVIGNSSYKSSPLKNPANDARTMARTLRKLGFDVDEKTDLNYFQFNEAVENFGNRLKTGGVGLFYYAGHGLQVQGNNYLVPVDTKMNSENEVRYKAIDAGLILAKMEMAKSDINIVVLDACRDNPFTRSFRSTSRGLANMEAPNGTIIAYATAPGKTASDGEGGDNGLYTAELVRVLETPGLKVEDVFKRVLKSVREKSGNAQVPWLSTSFEGDFYFTSPSSMTDLQLIPNLTQPLPKTTQDNVTLKKMASVPELIYADSSTGLMWARNGNISDDTMNWSDAMSWAKNLNYGGYNDWRLPTKEELESFSQRGGNRPSKWFNANGFDAVQSAYYWSGSNFASSTDSACFVGMDYGYVSSCYKYRSLYVWPVRSGQ